MKVKTDVFVEYLFFMLHSCVYAWRTQNYHLIRKLACVTCLCSEEIYELCLIYCGGCIIIESFSKFHFGVYWPSVTIKCHWDLTVHTKQMNSMIWVREWTIPTERPPLVGEVIANFSYSSYVVKNLLCKVRLIMCVTFIWSIFQACII
jgi:hypothetical protein